MEFAVVAPVLFMVVLGTIEMGRLVMIGQLVETAAARGCREAVKTATSSSSDVVNWVTNYLQGGGVPASAVTVDVDPGGLSSLNAGDDVTVTVQVSFAQVTWIPSQFVPSDTLVEASAVMARE